MRRPAKTCRRIVRGLSQASILPQSRWIPITYDSIGEATALCFGDRRHDRWFGTCQRHLRSRCPSPARTLADTPATGIGILAARTPDPATVTMATEAMTTEVQGDMVVVAATAAADMVAADTNAAVDGAHRKSPGVLAEIPHL